MNHNESRLQQQCVAWFRAQYPQYAMLLTHPVNEGNRNTRTQGAIHKAEGTVAGVPDLILFMHAYIKSEERPASALGIEMKTAKRRQSQQQKDFQRIFQAAGYKYVIVRSFDEFRDVINDYIASVNPVVRRTISAAHVTITQDQEQREREQFYKVIGKEQP